MSDLNFPAYPAWTSPGRSNWDQEDSAAQQAFQSAYNRSADQKAEMNMLTFRQQMAEKQQAQNNAIIAAKLTPVANAFAGVETPQQAWEVASKNPQWMADPIQGQFVDRILKTQNEIAKAEVGTIQGKINIADTTDFMKRLATIDPVDRSSIRSMSPNKDGSVSPQQWQALGLAEERLKVASENRRMIAENEAIARGDVATTTITDKGVSTTYKPGTKTANEAPQTKDIGDGITLAWVPGGKTLHVIKKNGDKNELTPAQLGAIAKGLDDIDPKKQKILDFLSEKATSQIDATKKTPLSSGLPPKPEQKILKYNPATGKVE